METKIVKVQYKKRDAPVGESGWFRVVNNFEPIYNRLYNYFEGEGFCETNSKSSTIYFQEELKKHYTTFDSLCTYSFNRKKGRIIPKFIAQPNEISFGAFINTHNSESGFIIKSNKPDLVIKMKEIIRGIENV